MLDLPQSRFKHFSFLVRKNQIYEISWNHNRKTNPICQRFGFRFETLHSEMSLLIKTTKFFKDDFYRMKIYNVRINNLGAVSLARPCVNCQAALSSHNFKEIWYTNEHGEFEIFN
jgi:tRNA(Arg) A34 adenosine deaminase TadA